jgi:hypothetical protein
MSKTAVSIEATQRDGYDEVQQLLDGAVWNDAVSPEVASLPTEGALPRFSWAAMPPPPWGDRRDYAWGC